MNELETALKTHDWGNQGYLARPTIDNLMNTHTDKTEALALWEQYCPWSDTNGGYIAWIRK